MTKEQQNRIESIMYEKLRRIRQYERHMTELSDEITQAEEDGEDERAESLSWKYERRRIYRDQKRNELNGMYELLEALGYSHTAIIDDDGNDVDLIITKKS